MRVMSNSFVRFSASTQQSAPTQNVGAVIKEKELDPEEARQRAEAQAAVDRLKARQAANQPPSNKDHKPRKPSGLRYSV